MESKAELPRCKAPGCREYVDTRRGGGRGFCARDYQRERRRLRLKHPDGTPMGKARAGGHVQVEKGQAVGVDTRVHASLAALLPELAKSEGMESPYQWLQFHVSKVIQRQAKRAGLL